ncbi:hypothetical protein C8R47DRAFT_72783 [Mycena vitilis]|nr:hypothetical protein C8R47DRAFT_72783 [Mycena vitilis]
MPGGIHRSGDRVHFVNEFTYKFEAWDEVEESTPNEGGNGGIDRVKGWGTPMSEAGGTYVRNTESVHRWCWPAGAGFSRGLGSALGGTYARKEDENFQEREPTARDRAFITTSIIVNDISYYQLSLSPIHANHSNSRFAALAKESAYWFGHGDSPLAAADPDGLHPDTPPWFREWPKTSFAPQMKKLSFFRTNGDVRKIQPGFSKLFH